MAPHSSTFAWKIPWMEEPGRPHTMGSQRVGHDWETSVSTSRFFTVGYKARYELIWAPSQSILLLTSLVAQTVKHLPAMLETWVQSLGGEDLQEKQWQPPPVFLPGKSHRRRSLVGYSPWGRKKSDTTEWLHFHFIYWNDIWGLLSYRKYTAIFYSLAFWNRWESVLSAEFMWGPHTWTMRDQMSLCPC